MTPRMKSILSRVLSEEIGRQYLWQAKERHLGLDDVVIDRDITVQTIKDFMEWNDIEFNQDSYVKARIS